jgi:hypothetical protein
VWPPHLASTTAKVTTDVDGRFTISIPADADSSAYIEVIPAAGDPHVTLHRRLPLSAGHADLGQMVLSVPTPAERAWLTQVNSDRAKDGAAPVVFDEAMMETAHAWASYMAAHGHFDHDCPASDPGCKDATELAKRFHAASDTSENIGVGDVGWQTIEKMFMDEKRACPNHSNAGCDFNENTGHYLNVVDPTSTWVGLAIVNNGKPFEPGSGRVSYFDQEFGGPQ